MIRDHVENEFYTIIYDPVIFFFALNPLIYYLRNPHETHSTITQGLLMTASRECCNSYVNPTVSWNIHLPSGTSLGARQSHIPEE